MAIFNSYVSLPEGMSICLFVFSAVFAHCLGLEPQSFQWLWQSLQLPLSTQLIRASECSKPMDESENHSQLVNFCILISESDEQPSHSSLKLGYLS